MSKEEKSFKEKSKKYLTVGKLKRLLESYPEDMLVGRVGHYGEFWNMDEYDISIGQCWSESRHGENFEEPLKIVEIHVPDIGEEPD